MRLVTETLRGWIASTPTIKETEERASRNFCPRKIGLYRATFLSGFIVISGPAGENEFILRSYKGNQVSPRREHIHTSAVCSHESSPCSFVPDFDR